MLRLVSDENASDEIEKSWAWTPSSLQTHDGSSGMED